MKIVAGTGHRPPKLFRTQPYSRHNHRLLVQAVTEVLQRLQPTRVISGGALGFDQALAQAAIDLKVPLHLYLPFKGFAERWPLESKTHLLDLMNEAERFCYICDPGYAAWKMQARNEAMVDSADVVLALWNGSPGGTANCVRYAEKRGVLIHRMSWRLS